MDEFNLPKEEYLSLRKEIAAQMKELGSLERNCVLAAAAVYAWLVKDGAASTIAKAGWYIPILFSLFGALRSLSIGNHIFAIGRYILEIEGAYWPVNTKPGGWEHFLRAPVQRHRVRTGITILFWIAFLLSTITLAWRYGDLNKAPTGPNIERSDAVQPHSAPLAGRRDGR